MNAEVTRFGILDMQVCVPKRWTNEQVLQFAEEQYPCGTSAGWKIRTNKGLLAGDPVRQPCAGRSDFVHIMLDS
jgi:hypothetical protein